MSWLAIVDTSFLRHRRPEDIVADRQRVGAYTAELLLLFSCFCSFSEQKKFSHNKHGGHHEAVLVKFLSRTLRAQIIVATKFDFRYIARAMNLSEKAAFFWYPCKCF